MKWYSRGWLFSPTVDIVKYAHRAVELTEDQGEP